MRLVKYHGLELDPSKISESTTVLPQVRQESRKSLAESAEGLPRVLLPRIEAIHAGTTRNNNRYLAEKLRGDPVLKSGVYSWLMPYAKPVIYNHDTNTEATGRIYNAAYSQFTRAGREGIIVIPEITDPSAIQKILDGRLLTVSIGATTDEAVCTCCGTDILSEGWCGHEKGETYDGVLCEWVAGNLFFDELSWVNVPADTDAMVIDKGHIGIAEAYAQHGKEIIDLSRLKTEWVLSNELAIAEGLKPTKEKEGANRLKTVEELQAEVEQLTTALEQVTTEKSQLEVQLETANASLETTTEALNTKTSELEEKTLALEAKTNELTEATTAKATAEARVSELDTLVEGFDTERTALMETNTLLASENHKSLAERVVDLKAVLGKVDKREEALDSHVSRSTESLKDTLADLLVESASFTPKRVVESLDNPGIGTLSGKEKNATVIDNKENVVVSKKVEELTNQDIVSLLLKPAYNTNK